MNQMAKADWRPPRQRSKEKLFEEIQDPTRRPERRRRFRQLESPRCFNLGFLGNMRGSVTRRCSLFNHSRKEKPIFVVISLRGVSRQRSWKERSSRMLVRL
jgi:hypothetical protein